MLFLNAKPSDDQLVRRVLRGKKEDFRLLVERYLGVVEAVAYAHVRNQADAEDVAQSAFLKAFTSLDSLREPAKFGAWIRTIARNAAVTVQRTRQRDAALRDALPDQPNAEEQDLDRRELRELLRREIDQLDENQREILLLFYFADKSLREIAALLDLTSNAAKKRLHRARAALSTRLTDEIGDLLKTDRASRTTVGTIMTAIAAAQATWETATALTTTGAIHTLATGKVIVGAGIAVACMAIVSVSLFTIAKRVPIPGRDDTSPPQSEVATIPDAPPENLAAIQDTSNEAVASNEDAAANPEQNDTIESNVASPGLLAQPSAGDSVVTIDIPQLQARVAANEALTSLIKLEYTTKYTYADLSGRALTGAPQIPTAPGARVRRVGGGRSFSRSTGVWAQDGAKFYWNSDYYYPGDEWASGGINASDGEVLKWLSKRTGLMQGTISEPDRFNFDMVGPLQLGIRPFEGKLPLSEALKAEHASIYPNFDSVKGRRAYVVDIERPIGSVYFGRFWIDQERGMPVYIEYYTIHPDSGEEGLVSKIDSIELRELPNGGWIPIKGVRSVYFHDYVGSEHISVDPRTITLRREDIPDSLFDIEFPEGCQVYNAIDGVRSAIVRPEN